MKTTFESYELEEGKCIFCNDASYKVLHEFRPFRVVRCNRCGLAFLTPRLKEQLIFSLYDSDDYFSEYSGEGTGYELQKDSLFRTFQRLVRILLRRKLLYRGSRVLEVGCGPGLFLKAVRPYVSYSVGVDLSQVAREEASVYCDVTYSSIDDVPCTEYFDCVVGLNLIEHIYDPVPFLKELGSRLIGGGTIL